MSINFVQLSRTMAYALRHHPAQFNLVLDEEGWVTIDALLSALRKRHADWHSLQEQDLTTLIAQSEKKRFEMQDGKIRAYYGHSVKKKVTYQPVVPPTVLFHGTTPQAFQRIRSEGLKPMGRQYVHLSVEEETARLVALRRTHSPVILRISALQAHQQGHTFYVSHDGVWLADRIPASFIHVDT